MASIPTIGLRHLAIIGALLLVCGTPLADTSGNNRTESYAYDDIGRLIRVERSDGSSIEYQYDATGNRIQEVRTPPPPPVFRLSVSKAGTGTGLVTSTPPGVNCGTTCAANFSAGAVVTLTATPSAAAIFGGWGGACSGAGVCRVTMNQARSVTATFNSPPPPSVFRLSVTKGGTGIGRVTSTPAGVNCGTTCAADFSAGAVVTLTATPAASTTFSGWGGACSGAGVCRVTMNQARTVTATFNSASGWVVIEGRVRLSNGTPICAMVLANGQYMFSCGGNGAYRLNVPLDSNGRITLFAFADGFAPHRWTSGPGGFPRDAVMQTADPDSPTIATTFDGQCSQPGWAWIWGSIRAVSGTPLCAMVLSNGQHMFSCQPVGSYALHVPMDENGRGTLFGFADGFQPYKMTFDGSGCR